MIKNATVQLPEIQVVKIMKGSHNRTPNATAELAAKASSTCSKTRRIRLAAQKVNAPQRNVSYQAGWGKGGNREGQAACCTEEDGAYLAEVLYADAAIAARRRRLCCSPGGRS